MAKVRKVGKEVANTSKPSTSKVANAVAEKKEKRHCRCAKSFKLEKDFSKWLLKVNKPEKKGKTKKKKKKCSKCKKPVRVSKAIKYFEKNVCDKSTKDAPAEATAKDKVQMLLQMAQLDLQ